MGNIIVIFQEFKKNVLQLMIDNLEGFTCLCYDKSVNFVL